MTTIAPVEVAAPAGWTRWEKRRLAAILGVIAMLHVGGVAFYLAGEGELVGAGGLAGAGVLAYVLGMRHAFDADHIAVIDDTTRAMIYRGRRPLGVGFFFAMGHSSVVVLLALLIFWGAGVVGDTSFADFTEAGGTLAAGVALFFLLLVAVLNSSVLRGLVTLWRETRSGHVDLSRVDQELASRGFIARLLGSKARSLISSSWHLYPVGLLMGLGLETASEVALLAVTANAAASGGVSLPAILSLPLLFAAGMSTFDTADSLIMTRLYSWSHRDPVRTLFFNIATTTMTVAIAVFVASVYASGLAETYFGWAWVAPLAAVGEHFELIGYVVAGVFVLTWASAAAIWHYQWRRNSMKTNGDANG